MGSTPLYVFIGAAVRETTVMQRAGEQPRRQHGLATGELDFTSYCLQGRLIVQNGQFDPCRPAAIVYLEYVVTRSRRT